MNYSTYRFTLDLQKHQSSMSIAVFQYDSAVRLHISLTDGGKPYFIQDGCYAVFYGKRADDAALIHDCDINNTEIVYEFNDTTAAVLGTVNAQLRLYSKDGKLITAPRFTIVVEDRVVDEDDIEITDAELEAIDNLFRNEQGRVEAEEARAEAEADRIAAEEARATAESARDTDETARSNAEIQRRSNEDTRIANENVRVASEQTRYKDENIRLQNESARETAEGVRVAAEVIRTSNETKRIANEDARKEAEAARESAEIKREIAEANRGANINHAVVTSEAALEVASEASETVKEVEAAFKAFKGEAAGDLSGTISYHNTSAEAHNDIRVQLSEFKERVNTLLNSDDTDLDQTKEIVAYIKANKSLIEGITTTKVNVSDIVDNLTSQSAKKPLSASQGFELKKLINLIELDLSSHQTAYETKMKALDSADKTTADSLAAHKTAYNAKMLELVTADKANADALAEHKEAYNAKVAQLESANKANADNLTAHKNAYNSKISALEEADQANANNFNTKVSALEAADKTNADNLTAHKTAYNAKVSALEAADTANSQALAEYKTESASALSSAVSTHNTSETSHNDIRLKLAEFNDKINTLLGTNDGDLASLQAVVDYIKENKDLIDEISTNKVNVSDIIDNLTTSDPKKPLSANQGVVIKGLIEELSNALNAHKTAYNTKVSALEQADSDNAASLAEQGESLETYVLDVDYADTGLEFDTDSVVPEGTSAGLNFETAQVASGELLALIDGIVKSVKFGAGNSAFSVISRDASQRATIQTPASGYNGAYQITNRHYVDNIVGGSTSISINAGESKTVTFSCDGHDGNRTDKLPRGRYNGTGVYVLYSSSSSTIEIINDKGEVVEVNGKFILLSVSPHSTTNSGIRVCALYYNSLVDVGWKTAYTVLGKTITIKASSGASTMVQYHQSSPFRVPFPT